VWLSEYEINAPYFFGTFAVGIRMRKERKDKNFIKKPVYPGGTAAIKAFIRDNLTYPPEALKHQVEGTVSLKYTIDHKGSVVETHIISGLGKGCDEEAVRLVRMLKFEVPKVRGIKVQFHKEMHVHFRLPKKQVKPTTTSTQYTYTTVPSKTPASSSGYHYTITVPGSKGKQDA
jgi:protein TonB